jgi:hypothetical protein
LGVSCTDITLQGPSTSSSRKRSGTPSLVWKRQTET